MYETKTTPVIPIAEHSIQFPKNYIAAREAFRQWTLSRSGEMKSFIKVASRFDNDLTIDYWFVPARMSSHKLVIISSGIHGAEAPAGHAAQSLIYKILLSDQKLNSLNFLFIHSMNPYGFKYFKRTTENNVDLNRNFATEEEFKTTNSDYERLSSLFHSREKTSASWITRCGFYIQALWHSIWNGKKSILRSLRGQYSYPQGIFFGGTQTEPQMIELQRVIAQIATPFSSIYHIDFHTGFGEKGQLHLFGSDEVTPETQKKIEHFFREFKIDTGHDEDFYSTYGDFSDWMWREFKNKSVISMTFEFGTLDSQTLSGGLLSLWTTVAENQGAHFGYLSDSDESKIKMMFTELFNPESIDWQRTILQNSYKTLKFTLQRFSESDKE